MRTSIAAAACGALLLFVTGCPGGSGTDGTTTSTYSISGTVTGAASVTVTLSGAAAGASTTTDGSGRFSFGGLANGSYTVTPSKAGFTFSPVSRTPIVNGANVTGCDFAASAVVGPTHAIRGTITRAWGGALAGATVTLGGAGSGSTLTDASGGYTFSNLGDGTYTVTPSLASWAFAPSAPNVAVSGADRTQDFTADGAYTVSGVVTTAWGTALPGVSVALSGGGVTKPAVTTNAAGAFSFAVPDGTYTVTATLASWVLTPSAPSVTVNGSSQGRNFTADGAYAISGTITGTVTAGVSIALSGGGVTKPAATSAIDGTYSFAGIPNGTYTLTPTLAGFSFAPAAPQVVVNGAGATQNFTSSGSGATFAVSGRITDGIAGIPGLTVRLTGTSAALQTTDASGDYLFAGLAAGDYTVTPATFGYVATPTSRPVTLAANAPGNDFTVARTGPPAFTFNGTLSYAGTRTGPVYVAVNDGQGGTGLVAQAPPWSDRAFTVRNVRGGGFNVTAWIDTLGTGRFNAGADPSVTVFANPVGSPHDLGVLTLVDPQPVTTVSFPLASAQVIPADGSAAVVFDLPRDSQGREVADSFRIYWNTTAAVSAGNTLGTLTVPAGPDFGIVRGLANGTAYWFRVEAFLNGALLPGQSVVTPAATTIGPSSGSATVTGTVTHPALGAPSALYVVADRGGLSGTYVQRIANPAGTQSTYSLSLPPGTYVIFAFVDLQDDGALLPGEPALFDNRSPRASLAAGQNVGPTIAIPAGKGAPSVTTHVWEAPFGSFTGLDLAVASNFARPLRATVTGPGLVGPVDMGIASDGGGSSIRLASQQDAAPVRPFVGDTYAMSVTYTDGTVDAFSVPVTGLFGSAPAVVAPGPNATGVSVTPTFQWNAPSSTPGAYAYELQIWPSLGGEDAIWQTILPATQTQVLYNVDGTALAPQLSGLTPFLWEIRASDGDGNTATRQAEFTTAAVPLQLYDPLSATTLDGHLWQTPQYARSISPTGKATLIVRGDNMQARTVQNVTYTSNVNAVPPAGGRVTTFQADVAVSAADVVRTGSAVVLGGIRLNYQPAANRNRPFPAQNLNFLTATVELFEDGTGLKVRRRFYHCDDAPCVALSGTGISVSDPVEFTAAGVNATAPAAYDTTYTFTISLNESTGVFTWTVGGGAFGPGVSGTGNVSAFAASVGMQLNSPTNGFSAAQLITRTSDDAGGGTGRIAASFDNVLVGVNGAPATLFDDYETRGSTNASGFSPALWGIPVNGGVLLTNGTLHLYNRITTANANSVGQSTVVNPMYPTTFNTWQADVGIAAFSSNAVGPSGTIQMGGAFYNDGSGGPNNATGDVRATITLGTDTASYLILRCINAPCFNLTGQGGPLPTSAAHPLGVGTVHTVFLRWNPFTQRFTFQLDDATPVEVDPTPVAPMAVPTAYVPVKYFMGGVGVGGFAGASVNLDATVSNVRVAP